MRDIQAIKTIDGEVYKVGKAEIVLIDEEITTTGRCNVHWYVIYDVYGLRKQIAPSHVATITYKRKA